MIRAFKIILICLIVAIAIWNINNVLNIYSLDFINGPPSYNFLVFPAILFMLSIASLIFNFKTLIIYKTIKSTDSSILDERISSGDNEIKVLVKIPDFLWILNLLYAAFIIRSGILYSFITSRRFLGLDAWNYFQLLGITLILIGIAIIAEAIRLKIIYTKLKKNNNLSSSAIENQSDEKLD